jgi:hypothetical protein
VVAAIEPSSNDGDRNSSAAAAGDTFGTGG